MRTSVLISALLLLLVANLLMMYVAPFGLVNIDGFQNATTTGTGTTTVTATTAPTSAADAAAAPPSATKDKPQPAPATPSGVQTPPRSATEGFATYTLASGGATGDAYEPMGAFDNIRLSTGNTISKWRFTAPNEPLQGPEFKPGPDELFMFKNNQCKPECCGASFSCDGGCVCTTPKQRDLINQRGGNRTAPDDGV